MAKTMGDAFKIRTRKARSFDWRRRISDHVAFALLTYTALQIFFTMHQLKSGHGSILPYFGLIVLVAAIIPGCRWFEKRWEGLSDADATNAELAPAFRRDVIVLWACAIGLPLGLTGIFKAVTFIF